MKASTCRLLLVDDEPLARMRIRSFDLAAYGYEIVGEAENGEQAWRMIGQSCPDIVIADIGMPVMNGLDLLQRIKAMPAGPAVILLTCYEDFDKAQRALRGGAVDYLTKLLLSEDDFLACLNRVAGDMRTKREQDQRKVGLLLQEQLLSGTATASAEEWNQALAMFRQFRVGLLRFPPDAKLVAWPADELWETDGLPYASFAVGIGDSLWAVVFASTEANGSAEFNAWTMNALRAGYESCALQGRQPLMALAMVTYRPERISDSIQVCRKLLERAYYAPRGRVIAEEGSTAGLSAAPIDGSKELYAAIKLAGEESDCAALETGLEAWLRAVSASAPGEEQLKHAVVELGHCFAEDCVLEDGERTISIREHIREAYERSGHMTGLEASIRLLGCRLKEEALPGSRVRPEIREAISYIRGHYQEDIDLVTVARCVNLSASWFGTLFRNETGRSFQDYLQAYRLEQAKAMMAQSDLKIYEISLRVGIANPRYFSRLFSDKYSISPQDYRNRVRGRMLG